MAWLLILMGVLSLLLVYGREYGRSLPCVQESLCHPEQLWWVDQWSVHFESLSAVALSDALQFVVQWLLPSILLCSVAQGQRIRLLLEYCFYVLSAVFWTECIRLWIWRPRPYVYLDPQLHAGAPASYTSFFSGHTLMVVTVLMWLSLVWKDRTGRLPYSWIYFVVQVSLLTAMSRVLGGRHFITDVGVSALMAVMWVLSSYKKISRYRKLEL